MAELLQFSEEHLVLSSAVPPAARSYIQQAINHYEDTEKAESLLLKAHQLVPEELEIYISIYKFYFYKKHFNSAENFANLALQEAAKQGEIVPDWNQLNADACNWLDPTSAQRVYLYTMKALGFIYLRTERTQLSLKILSKLQELDVNDLVGGSVIMSLANNMLEEESADAA
jgi:tetratricopeptide (TPR) repeat protein